MSLLLEAVCNRKKRQQSAVPFSRDHERGFLTAFCTHTRKRKRVFPLDPILDAGEFHLAPSSLLTSPACSSIHLKIAFSFLSLVPPCCEAWLSQERLYIPRWWWRCVCVRVCIAVCWCCCVGYCCAPCGLISYLPIALALVPLSLSLWGHLKVPGIWRRVCDLSP